MTESNPAPARPARLRQAVLAVHDLDAVAARLRTELGLGEPFHDPAVGYFGLRNAVFALGDTFLELVSPQRPDTSAGRFLERRGGDCGYMVMLEVDQLAPARERASGLGIREVFAVTLEDMDEVHLHPADMRGAIVSLSRPEPPGAWRWGGPGWAERGAPLSLIGAGLAVAEPDAVQAQWHEVLGTAPSGMGIRFEAEASEPGLTEIVLATDEPTRSPLAIGTVQIRSIALAP